MNMLRRNFFKVSMAGAFAIADDVCSIPEKKDSEFKLTPGQFDKLTSILEDTYGKADTVFFSSQRISFRMFKFKGTIIWHDPNELGGFEIDLRKGIIWIRSMKLNQSKMMFETVSFDELAKESIKMLNKARNVL